MIGLIGIGIWTLVEPPGGRVPSGSTKKIRPGTAERGTAKKLGESMKPLEFEMAKRAGPALTVVKVMGSISPVSTPWVTSR